MLLRARLLLVLLLGWVLWRATRKGDATFGDQLINYDVVATQVIAEAVREARGTRPEWSLRINWGSKYDSTR